MAEETPEHKMHVAIISCGAEQLNYITTLLNRGCFKWKEIDLRPYFREYRPPEYGLRETSDYPRTAKAVYRLKSFADAVISTMKDLHEEKFPILVLHCNHPWATAHCVGKTMVQLLNSLKYDIFKYDGIYSMYRARLFTDHEWPTMDLMIDAVNTFIDDCWGS